MPPRAVRPLFRVRDRAQVEALASPARQEVVDGLQVLGPCSVAALAELLGRAPDSLYYHVRKLERVGLVVTRGGRRAGARTEALYDVPGRLVLHCRLESPRERRALRDVMESALRIGARDYRAALESGRAVLAPGSRRNVWGGRVKGWLTPAELDRARAHAEALGDLLARGRKRPDAQLYAVAYVLVPLTPTRRSSARRPPQKS